MKAILILTARPGDKETLRADKEIKAIEEELERSKNRKNFRIIPKGAVNPGDLDFLLQKEKPEIIHFCGHGKEEGIVLENDAEKSHVVPLESLAHLLGMFKNTECVVLNACYSDTQAQEIQKYVRYVIGMKEQIEDTAAIEFATHFYRALFANYDYKDAYRFGEIAVGILGIENYFMPVFLEKPSIREKSAPKPLSPDHYDDVIYAFIKGRVIPFLGSGINLYDGQSLNQIISDIQQLVSYLARISGIRAYKNLVGCSICLVAPEDLPKDCPVKKAWSEGTTASCPFANEQALAIAKLNLQSLAQYEQLRGSNIKDIYQNLRLLFESRLNTNKLHDFFAKLPEKMKKKGYPLLPYKLLVTTNYDDMLECAFRAAKQPFDLVSYVAEGEENRGRFRYKPHDESARSTTSAEEVLKKDRPVILKLYGAVENENFVITEEHHINYLVYRQIEQLLPKDLLEILRESHNILFMGYSPNDANLRLIINRLWGESGKTESEIGKDSWMIHKLKPGLLDKTFWRKRNVELLESDLEEYLTKLNQRIEALIPKKSPYELWRQ